MDTIEERVREAKTDVLKLEKLMEDYLPYIRSQAAAVNAPGLEYDDKLSIAMLVFAGCVRQYENGRGSFLHFAAVSIRNRLLDELRRGKYAGAQLPLHEEGEDGELPGAEEEASLSFYSREEERLSLAEEIEAYSTELTTWGISFRQLSLSPPRQERSRRQCQRLAWEILSDEKLNQTVSLSGRLPQKELADRFKLSVKTVEKHRRYILAVYVLLKGDYPGIRTFIIEKEGKGERKA